MLRAGAAETVSLHGTYGTAPTALCGPHTTRPPKRNRQSCTEGCRCAGGCYSTFCCGGTRSCCRGKSVHGERHYCQVCIMGQRDTAPGMPVHSPDRTTGKSQVKIEPPTCAPLLPTSVRLRGLVERGSIQPLAVTPVGGVEAARERAIVHKHTVDCCWRCRDTAQTLNSEDVATPPATVVDRERAEVTAHILWTLPMASSCVHIQGGEPAQRCQQAHQYKPLLKSTRSMDIAISWGRRLCTLCHDRLTHACKTRVASAPAHFVPRRRITSAAMAPQDPPRASTVKPWPTPMSPAPAPPRKKQRT